MVDPVPLSRHPALKIQVEALVDARVDARVGTIIAGQVEPALGPLAADLRRYSEALGALHPRIEAEFADLARRVANLEIVVGSLIRWQAACEGRPADGASAGLGSAGPESAKRGDAGAGRGLAPVFVPETVPEAALDRLPARAASGWRAWLAAPWSRWRAGRLNSS